MKKGGKFKSDTLMANCFFSAKVKVILAIMVVFRPSGIFSTRSKNHSHAIYKILKWLFQRLQCTVHTVLGNYRKGLIQHCERSELHLHFDWTKVNLKMPKMVHFDELLKTWSLQSNSVTRQVIFNRTKIGGNHKIRKFKWDIFWWFSNNERYWANKIILLFQCDDQSKEKDSR